jgi:CelD/BcsL family acetyltransferase involved in cellulose biosynthesis
MIPALPVAFAPGSLQSRVVRPAPRAVDPASTLCVELVRDRAAFDRVSADWQDLEQASEGALVFQSAAWARAVLAFEQERGNAAFAPVIVTARRGGRLLAVLPLQLIRAQGRRALVPLGDGFAQYAGIVASGDMDAEPVIAQMLRAATTGTGCDVVLLRKLRADSALRAALPANAISIGPDLGAPSLTLTAWPDFEACHKSLKSKSRKLMRNARNRLERTGVLDHEVATSAEAYAGVVQRTLSGRAARLKSQGLTSRAFADGGFSRFCALLAERRPGYPGILAMSLTHDGVPIAEQWGLVHQGRYYAYVASRDFERSDVSPGKLHLKEVVQTAYAQGLHTVDLLPPVMPYKKVWARDVAEVRDYAIPVTLLGRIVTTVFDAWLRPLIKSLLLKLPPHVRALMTSVRD